MTGNEARAVSKYGVLELASSSSMTRPIAATRRARHVSDEGSKQPESTRKYSSENSEGRMGYQMCTRAENAANALMSSC